MHNRPDKVAFLEKLQSGGFNIPDFIYLSSEALENDCQKAITSFLGSLNGAACVIVRSAHPLEAHFKGGTFDSFESTADLDGIRLAFRKIVRSCRTSKRLAIRRQQVFEGAPPLDPDDMGILIMPYVDGRSVMAKTVGTNWEFGYARQSDNLIFRDPYLTSTPHDTQLYILSERIRRFLGFRCEIEYILSGDGQLFIVQARDISGAPTIEEAPVSPTGRRGGGRVRFDGVLRVRGLCNHRIRPVFIMNNRGFSLEIIDACSRSRCSGGSGDDGLTQRILEIIDRFDQQLEMFSLSHPRYAVLGTDIHLLELFHFIHHFFEKATHARQQIEGALRKTQYSVESFLAEADTLIAKHKTRFNLCTHNAYGISSVSNPLWTVFWNEDRSESILNDIELLGIQTGDIIEIEIEASGIPVLYRV
jgi:hypothetical protein